MMGGRESAGWFTFFKYSANAAGSVVTVSSAIFPKRSGAPISSQRFFSLSLSASFSSFVIQTSLINPPSVRTNFLLVKYSRPTPMNPGV